MRKFVNISRIPIICGTKKFCFGHHKFVNKSNCNCTSLCKMAKPVYYLSNFECVFTNKKKSSKDCNCKDRCAGDKSELSLYFN